MNRKIPFLILLILIFSCSHNTNNEKKVVARVGNEVLSIDELKERIPEELVKKTTLTQIKGMIEQWVNTQLVYQQAYRIGLHNTLSEELQAELKKFEMEFLANKLIEREINRKIKVSDEEIEAYYNRHKEQFIRNTMEIRAFHLLVRSEELSETIANIMKEGKSLEELVSVYVEQSVFWPNGDLGFFAEEALPADIKRALSSLKINETTKKGIKSDFGFHFFKILDRQAKGTTKNLEEVRNQITEKLKVEKHKDAYSSYLAKLRTKAEEQKSLEINFEPLKEFQQDTTGILIK